MVRPYNYSQDLSYDLSGTVSDGDAVIDHREDGDGDVRVYRRDVRVVDDECKKVRDMLDDEVVGVTTVTNGAVGTLKSSFCDSRYRCEETGDVFVTGEAPAGSPKTCPACGADWTRDDVNDCTDAHASDDSQDGQADGQGDATGGAGARDAQGDEPTQETLAGFGGDN